MKTILALAALSLSFSSFAMTIKTCDTVIRMPDEAPIVSKFEVFDKEGVLSSKITQRIAGQNTSYTDEASLAMYSVREGLTEASDPEAHNVGENLIVHAMILENDPVFEGTMSSGIDLKKVRSVKVYTIGKATHMGMTAIVEARDGRGRLMGSYLGGFLVSPCR